MIELGVGHAIMMCEPSCIPYTNVLRLQKDRPSDLHVHTMATATIPRLKTDWTKCCLCQEDRGVELKSPPTRYATEQDGNSVVLKNTLMFQSINGLSITFDPIHLDEGSGVEETFQANKAKYHQSCRVSSATQGWSGP